MALLEVTEASTQTDDGSSFYTFYEHIQAQRQETLLVEEQLERTFQQLDRTLTNITGHQDRNFHFLAHQLKCEFNAYMQFALSNTVNRVLPIPPPLLFPHPRSSQFPPVPEFCTASPNPFYDEFDRVEVEIQTAITEQESRGRRPSDRQRPWSNYPFGRHTRSQAQYAKRHAQREEYLEKR